MPITWVPISAGLQAVQPQLDARWRRRERREQGAPTVLHQLVRQDEAKVDGVEPRSTGKLIDTLV